MAAQVRDEEARTTLWGAICHMRRVQVAYDRALGAPSRHATCLRLLLPVDEMHADAATPAHDDRSPEDKARAATSAWMAMHGWLGWTDKPSASQALRSVIDDEPVRDAVGLVLALWCIADGHGDKRMRYRGRDAK